MRQVLDESCITTLIGGAGTRKSQTLVACIKAPLWQQGLLFAQNPDPANLGTINMGKKVGGPEGDTPPPACVLVTAPTNAQVDNLLTCVRSVMMPLCFVTGCSATIQHPGCDSVPNGLLPHQGCRPLTS